MKKGNAVTLLPMKNPWQPLIDSLRRFSKDFMSSRNQPKTQQREYLQLD